MAAPLVGKKIRQSKNRKKYWKKHVNLTDVDEFLEEKRQEERLGGSVQGKTDKQLFVIDTKGSQEYDSQVRKLLPKLRCFQNLLPSSAVPPPIKPPQKQGVSTKVKSPQTWSRNRKDVKPPPQRRKKHKDANVYDLWSARGKAEKLIPAADVDRDFLPDAITRTTVKVPEYRYQKPSLLPAVEAPHPGASYNPTYEDHQELLLQAHLIEEKRKKEDDRLDRQLTQKFPKVKPTEASWLEEMSVGLFDNDDTIEDNTEANEVKSPAEPKTWGVPVTFENRKTKADKNLDKVRKREKRKVLLEKLEKKRLNDVNGVKALKKAIVKEEAASEVRIKKRDQKASEAMYKARKLGPCKYVAPDIEIKLGEELPDNLRTLKVEGHLMEDRFKSFQRRNVIEPRVRQKRKKKSVKRLLRRTHKD